jgi:hypothetical protein
MDYDTFFARYTAAHEAWTFGRSDRAAALTELARLRRVLGSIEPPDDRAMAAYLLEQWANETSYEAADRFSRAAEIVARAEVHGGTAAQRMARVEGAIAEITGIADETSDVAERYAILGMTETLAELLDDLRRAAR